MKYDYLIVGAGLFGSVCAHELNRRGKRVLVLEKRTWVGGNCRTEDIDGIPVHVYGPHIFHTSNQTVWEYVNTFSAFAPFTNAPLANYRGEIYNLPFNMNTFYRLWGVKTPQEAERAIQSQVVKYARSPCNLEEQALSLVGRDIYEKLVKGYTEKQWGKSCKELPAFLIRRLPLRLRYDNNYFNDTYQGVPQEGYTRLFEQLLLGIEVRLGVNYLQERERYENIAKKIIYTGTVDEFFDYRLGALEYRSLRFETERLEVESFQGNAVVNYSAREVPYTRIIEHKHFTQMQTPYTVISREYPLAWNPSREPYYPVNDEKNDALYRRYMQLAKQTPNVRFGGRLGGYRYADMDKTILSAWETVKRIEGE